jgi:large exoprotein involved in heme utilization and adhesion
VGTSGGGTSSGLFSTVEAGATGNGGNLQINTNKLLITDGAQIAVSTTDAGDAGQLLVEANQIELIGASEFGASGLFSNAIVSIGDGGSIEIKTNLLSILDGATISASNFSSRDPDTPPGQGAAGAIDITAKTLTLDSTISNISNKSSRITTSNNAQTGGNITLNVDGDIALSNHSQIISETKGEGDAGSINISATEFNLNDQGQVSTNSTGLGQAGNIAIASPNISLTQSQITATSTQTGGGEIKLTTDYLLLERNSLISTSVLDSTGGGGNIFIDNSGFITGRNNSDIKADAEFGQGGNIQINSTGIFLDADSEITASSQFGVDGVVEINNTESDKKLGTVLLSDRVLISKPITVSSCPVSHQNSLTITGLGGLSDNPVSYLRGTAIWTDLRILSGNSSDFNRDLKNLELKSANSEVNTITEFQAWRLNHQGNVELIATTPQKNTKIGFVQPFKCRTK